MLNPPVTNAPIVINLYEDLDFIFGTKYDFKGRFNGEPVQIYHPKSANTDGQLVLLFRTSDVLVAGDVVDMTSYPVIDTARGGTINGIIAGLNRILDITVPKDKQEGGTMVIPGHGRIADEADVVEYRDMVTIIRDRVQQMMKKGMTLAQIKADKAFAAWELVKQARLPVMPVPDALWERVIAMAGS